MKRAISLAGACLVAASLCANSYAQERSGYYIGFDANHIINELEASSVTKAEFGLASLGARVGFYIEPQVGLEFYGASGVSEDQDQGLSMQAVSSLGLLGRFESPESNGGKLYILLGYGASEIELQRSVTSLPDRELYHGFVYGGGFEFRIGNSANHVNIQGLKYYNEDNLSLSGVSLGLRHQF